MPDLEPLFGDRWNMFFLCQCFQNIALLQTIDCFILHSSFFYLKICCRYGDACTYASCLWTSVLTYLPLQHPDAVLVGQQRGLLLLFAEGIVCVMLYWYVHAAPPVHVYMWRIERRLSSQICKRQQIAVGDHLTSYFTHLHINRSSSVCRCICINVFMCVCRMWKAMLI